MAIATIWAAGTVSVAMICALVLAGILAFLAIYSFRYQFQNFRRLRSQTLASDDRRYLRNQIQRRSFNALLMLILAGMLAGAYLSGMQQHLEQRIQDLPQQREAGQPPTEDDRQFVRSWSIYWLVAIAIVFTIMVIAILDYVATSLYGRQQLRLMANEHRTLLERDLAVLRQQKANDRLRRLEE
jgi:NADH:ubiquinone oxidoreductase subunit 5 (subunit L)/multisubunit Na+/H+ antiporter MnhA subunit